MIVRLNPSIEDIKHVCLNMRDINAREIFALSWHEDRGMVADQIILLGKRTILRAVYCTNDGEPACLIAGYLSSPGVASIQMIATDLWPIIAGEAYLELKGNAIPNVLAPTVRRAQCQILATNGSRKWVERLGFAEEGLLRGLGKNGEDFVPMAWLNPHPPAVDAPQSAVRSAAVTESH